jgi:hypothetical protein
MGAWADQSGFRESVSWVEIGLFGGDGLRVLENGLNIGWFAG